MTYAKLNCMKKNFSIIYLYVSKWLDDDWIVSYTRQYLKPIKIVDLCLQIIYI